RGLSRSGGRHNSRLRALVDPVLSPLRTEDRRFRSGNLDRVKSSRLYAFGICSPIADGACSVRADVTRPYCSEALPREREGRARAKPPALAARYVTWLPP